MALILLLEMRGFFNVFLNKDNQSICAVLGRAGSWSNAGQLLPFFLVRSVSLPRVWVLGLGRVNEISRACSESEPTDPEPLPPIRGLSAVDMLNNTRSFRHGVLRVLRSTRVQ